MNSAKQNPAQLEALLKDIFAAYKVLHPSAPEYGVRMGDVVQFLINEVIDAPTVKGQRWFQSDTAEKES